MTPKKSHSPKSSVPFVRTCRFLVSLPAFRSLLQYLSLSLSLLFAPQTSWAAIHVLLDPGHGGTDKGAVYGQARESKVVLQIAQELELILKKDPQFEVSLTRSSDQYLSLQERVKKSEELDADILVSLHANAAPDRKIKGMEIYFQSQNPLPEENYFLGQVENQIITASSQTQTDGALSRSSDVLGIVNDLRRQGRIKLSLFFAEILNRNWSGSIKQAPFFVLNQPKSPSVLIEVGFLSHAEEAKSLMNPTVQRELAQKIYQSLIKYFSRIKTSRNQLSKVN